MHFALFSYFHIYKTKKLMYCRVFWRGDKVTPIYEILGPYTI